jgi:hypothetical protein
MYLSRTREFGKILVEFFENEEVDESLREQVQDVIKQFSHDFRQLISNLSVILRNCQAPQNSQSAALIRIVNEISVNTPQETIETLEDDLKFLVQEPEIKLINETKIEINGFRYKISSCNGELQNLIHVPTHKIKQVNFFAAQTIILDCNFDQETWHGKTLTISTERLIIPSKQVINLSGKSQIIIPKKAHNGENHITPGTDGEDGADGESSGNIIISTNEVIHPENLTIKLNGALGSPGGEGGDGWPGMNGKEKEIVDVKTVLRKIEKGEQDSKQLLTSLQGFKWSIKKMNLLNHSIQTYDHFEGVNADKIECIFSISKNKMAQLRAFMILRGAKGMPGTKGGKGGLGGQGGFKGKCDAWIRNTNEEINFNVNALHGQDGQHGEGMWYHICCKAHIFMIFLKQRKNMKKLLF